MGLLFKWGGSQRKKDMVISKAMQIENAVNFIKIIPRISSFNRVIMAQPSIIPSKEVAIPIIAAMR